MKIHSNRSNPLDESDKFCRNCSTPVQTQPNPTVSTKTGKDSVNIGVGNLPNANIHVGDKYYEVEKKPREIVYVERTSAQELKIGNVSLKTSWFTLVGGLGSIASIISALVDLKSLNLFSWNPLLWLFFFAVFSVLLIFGMVLQRFRFLSLELLNRNIEAGSDGRIYITKIGGTCPRCGSDLRLLRVGPENNKKTILVCKRNPSQHRWGFDPPVLSDLS